MKEVKVQTIGVRTIGVRTVGVQCIGGVARGRGSGEQWFQFDVTPLDSGYKLKN